MANIAGLYSFGDRGGGPCDGEHSTNRNNFKLNFVKKGRIGVGNGWFTGLKGNTITFIQLQII